MSMSEVEILHAACCIAGLDGRITPRERSMVQVLAERAGVGAASLQAMLDYARKTPNYYERVLERVRTDPEETMRALLWVAISDGSISDDERVVLQFFADKVGMSHERFDSLLGAAERTLRKENDGATKRHPDVRGEGGG